MVPPGDMWLAFTVDGKNSGWDNIWNYVNAANKSLIFSGHHVYVTAWHSGKTVYFPSQGFRNAGGSCWRNGAAATTLTYPGRENGTVITASISTPYREPSPSSRAMPPHGALPGSLCAACATSTDTAITIPTAPRCRFGLRGLFF